MPYRFLSHTADVGLEATAPSFTGLVETLAAGMFALIADIRPCVPEREITVTVAAETPEELVVDALSDLLYRSEVDDIVFCEFEALQADDGALTVTARGVDAVAAPLTGAPVKAVTYHDLDLRSAGSTWYARVFFDV